MFIFKVLDKKTNHFKLTSKMKGKNKTVKFQSKNIKSSFTGSRMTLYSGLAPIMKFFKRDNIAKELNQLFPTKDYSSLKFSKVQLMLSVVMASLSGVNRLSRIAVFTHDELVKALLGLKKGLNKDVISTSFKKLGQRGAVMLHEYSLKKVTTWLTRSQLRSITLDVDSTVFTVYGNQAGAAKGYNSEKKGAKSYHCLLGFCSQMKLIVNNWFRTGSAYTSNGIVDFTKQMAVALPGKIANVFYRADSGFFNGKLFDLLEDFGWKYLVKAKFKGMKERFKSLEWTIVDKKGYVCISEFEYKAASWSKSRMLKVIRTIEKWEKRIFFGKTEMIPVYQYACYCSNLKDKTALELHQIYKERSTSETWIEQVKSQLLAGKTLTDDFHANDILWQLSIMAYNLSVVMRYKVKKIFRQEHATFRNWFINVAARITYSGRYINQHLYKHYYEREKWEKFSVQLE